MEVATLRPLDFRHRDRRGLQVTGELKVAALWASVIVTFAQLLSMSRSRFPPDAQNGRYFFYEKAFLVKPTWRLRDRPRRTATIAPLRYASIRTGVGPAFSDGPVHDGVRPDLKALQSVTRSPSKKRGHRIVRSRQRDRVFRALAVGPPGVGSLSLPSVGSYLLRRGS